MQAWLKIWTPDEVQNQSNGTERSKAYAGYLQQRLGVPYPAIKDFVILRKKANGIFSEFPHADWRTLCKVADYCKGRKYRPERAYKVLDRYREAWAAGYAPELDFNYAPPRPDLDIELRQALEQEDHESWRRRLIMAQDIPAKEGVLAAWRLERRPSPTSR